MVNARIHKTMYINKNQNKKEGLSGESLFLLEIGEKMIELFDSHAHYNNPQYDLDRDKVIKKAFADGITKIINAGYSIESSKKAIKIAEEYSFIYRSSSVFLQMI